MNIVGILLAILASVELAKGMYNLVVIRYDQENIISLSIANAMYKNDFHVVTF